MDAPLSPIVTLRERRARETDRRRAAVDAMALEMRAYGSSKGGRFLVFGSAATGTIGDRSDLDVIADFPPDLEADALTFLEDLAARHALPLDLHTLPASTPAFLAAIGPGALVLP